MHTIEVDFDVFKELMIRRETEEVSFNDVLRKILGLPPVKALPRAKAAAAAAPPWVSKGVSFPDGTKFRATYKGQTCTGIVENGALVVNGERFNSPSAAAISITGNPVNGWRFWECRKPGQQGWTLIAGLRRN